MSDTPSLQALSPQAMVVAAEHHVIDKASKKFTRAFLLAILAGASIALAFCFYTTAVAALGDGPGKVGGGLFFALGLFLVVLLGGFIADLVIFDDDFRIQYVVQNGFVKSIAELV